MKKSKAQIESQLAENRATIERLTPLVEAGTATDEQVTELRTVLDDSEALQKDLELMEAARTFMIKGDKARGKKKETPEEKIAKRFSITETIRNIKAGKDKVEGVTREIHQEAEKEAREAGVNLQGVGLPQFISDISARRTAETEARAAGVDATVAATAANLISTDLYGFVDALRPKLKLAQLGVPIWGNLRGNVDIPAGDAITSASFYTEQATASASDPTTKKVTLSPKRLAVWSSSTLQLEAQASIDVDNWLLQNILYAEANKIEATAILGGGTNEFDGILAMTGTTEIVLAGDANTGAAPTRANLLAMETAVEDANAEDSMMGFLTTNGVKGYLRNLASNGDGSPFVWDKDNEVIGYQAVRSSLVPNTLVKGAGAAENHAIIFGSYRNYILGNWGVRDLVVDEVTQKKAGITEVIMNSFWDGACVHPKHFAVIKTAKLP